MILSFHPCFTADTNIICAGRDPGENEMSTIRAAKAVILPQGCRETLYVMAQNNCPHVFPDYDKRFKYPGKIGQARLFEEFSAPFPCTETYNSLKAFYRTHEISSPVPSFSYPFVLKFDWGDEGSTVFFIKTKNDFQAVLDKAAAFEKTGQTGFLLQEYIPSLNRTLRVVVIGRKTVSYWRIQNDPDCFGNSLAKGAVIDPDIEPIVQKKAAELTVDFCSRTGINLAGFDFLLAEKTKHLFFLEINYFFGRKGLGGSESFYNMLVPEIDDWLSRLGLTRASQKGDNNAFS